MSIETNNEIRKRYKKLGAIVKLKGCNEYGTPIVVSVNNIYTGVTFKIGDTISFGSFGEREIQSFSIFDNAIKAVSQNYYMSIVYPDQKPKTYPA